MTRWTPLLALTLACGSPSTPPVDPAPAGGEAPSDTGAAAPNDRAAANDAPDELPEARAASLRSRLAEFAEAEVELMVAVVREANALVIARWADCEVQEGEDPEVCADMAGHTVTAVTARWPNGDDEAVLDAMEELGAGCDESRIAGLEQSDPDRDGEPEVSLTLHCGHDGDESRPDEEWKYILRADGETQLRVQVGVTHSNPALVTTVDATLVDEAGSAHPTLVLLTTTTPREDGPECEGESCVSAVGPTNRRQVLRYLEDEDRWGE